MEWEEWEEMGGRWGKLGETQGMFLVLLCQSCPHSPTKYQQSVHSPQFS